MVLWYCGTVLPGLQRSYLQVLHMSSLGPVLVPFSSGIATTPRKQLVLRRLQLSVIFQKPLQNTEGYREEPKYVVYVCNHKYSRDRGRRIA